MRSRNERRLLAPQAKSPKAFLKKGWFVFGIPIPNVR
jgi:hypothetical protein